MRVRPKEPIETNLPHIKKITNLWEQNQSNQLIEFSIETQGITENCFDEEKVALYLSYGLDGANENTQSGFLYADGEWRIRISVAKAGDYKGRIELRLSSRICDSFDIEFEVTAGDNRTGILQVEPVNRKHFMFENGEIFTAIGENVAWGYRIDDDGVEYYRRLLRKFKNSGANWTRIWLTAEWYINLIDKNGEPGDFSGKWEQAKWLDEIINLLEENGVYAQIVLFNHGNLRANGSDIAWHDFGFNKDTNGGYLENTADFFTDQRAIKDTKSYFRYVLSRYGYSCNVLCWELFNEVNMAQANEEQVAIWHRNMTEYIRSIDIRPHMVSTSASNTVYRLIYDEIFDFINIHRYGNIANVYHMIADVYWTSKSYNRPVLLSECGASWSSSFTNATSIHQHLSAGMMCNSAGSGMLWYWRENDTLENTPIYNEWRILKEFCDRIPWNAVGHTCVLSSDISLKKPFINAMGYQNKDYAYLWFYDNRFSFDTPDCGKVESADFKLDLEEGNYSLEWIDLRTGAVVSSETVYTDGKETVLHTPIFEKDIALAVEKRSSL